VWKRAHVEIIGSEIVRPAIGRPADFGGLQCWLDDTSDAERDLVLKLQDVLHIAVEAVGPEMVAGRGVDELCGDAHSAAGFAHRTFEDIADTQFATDLLHVDRLAFVSEAAVTGDDEQPADAGKRGDDFLDHAVGEVILLRVAAHVLEREYRDRRLVG